MIIKEYRIIMPMTVDEYQIGQLYSLTDASLNETGGGDGIEIVRNDRFDNIPLLGGRYRSGQYTMKRYHIASKVPKFLRICLPKTAMEVMEESWNAHPYCKTVITNPKFLGKNFTITIESLHLPDRGTQENVHELPPDKLAQREVIFIDIAKDPVLAHDYSRAEDPTLVKSNKTGRGPLRENWSTTCDPVMTCYKLVKAEFKYFGLQNRVENIIQRAERRIFTKFHRQVFCWMDKWYNLTLEEIHAIEERIQTDLDRARNAGPLRGMSMEGEN